MKHHQTPRSTTHKRQPRPTARDLIVGHDTAKHINRGHAKLHLRPVNASHHPKRFTPGQALNVRAFVGGPTWCRVLTTMVDRVALGDALNLSSARLAGYRTTDELAEAFERSYGNASRVWVIAFRLDLSEAPRLLAARSEDLYVTSPAMALADEPEALSEADWKRHVDGNRDLEHAQWLALGHAHELARMRRAPKHGRLAA